MPLFFIPRAVRVDSTGTPYSGAKAHFYLTGTTTDTDTYTNSALSVASSNPVIANAAGQFAPIYLDPAITYRCILKQSDNTQIDDVDPVSAPITGTAVAITDSGAYFTATNVETILAEIGAGYAKIAASNTWSADQTLSSATWKFADNVLERPQIKDFGITHSAPAATATVTFDLSISNSFVTTLTENVTITLSNPPATGTFGQATIKIIQDGGGGAYTAEWPAAVLWPGGPAPVISTGNDAVDVVTVFTIDAGVTWYGNFSQAYA